MRFRPSAYLASIAVAAATAAVAVSAPAVASTPPTASLTAVHHTIFVNRSPAFRATLAHVPSGSVTYLQRQFGTAHVWKNVVQVHHLSSTVTAPKLTTLGRYVYRLRMSSGSRTLAVSRTQNIYAYGNISLGTLCQSARNGAYCPGTQTEQVGSTIFTYNVVMYTHQYPDFSAAFTLPKTSCRSLSVRWASANQGDSNAVVLQTVQSGSDPQQDTDPVGQIRVTRFALDGGAFYLNAAYSSGDGTPEIAAAGSASCWTRSGTR